MKFVNHHASFAYKSHDLVFPFNAARYFLKNEESRDGSKNMKKERQPYVETFKYETLKTGLLKEINAYEHPYLNSNEDEGRDFV